MEKTGNALFDAYINEKEKETDTVIANWANALWKHFVAFQEAGFDEQQSMYLLEIYWERVDEMYWRRTHG